MSICFPRISQIPGPWRRQRQDADVLVTAAHGQIVAVCRTEVDARLVAAAPAMYEMLDRLRAAARRRDVSGRDADAIECLLALADGRNDILPDRDVA